jgi:hypothetical protein
MSERWYTGGRSCVADGVRTGMKTTGTGEAWHTEGRVHEDIGGVIL